MTPRDFYFGLRRTGMDPHEAGNVTAYRFGLPPVSASWRPSEVAAVLFVRWLVESDRLRASESRPQALSAPEAAGMPDHSRPSPLRDTPREGTRER